MKKIILIVGRTASGKDTLSRILCERLGLTAVVSYTDRPIRPGEQNGREHVFLSPEEFTGRMQTEHVAAYTRIGQFRYMATAEAIRDAGVYVIDPEGVTAFRTHMSGRCIPLVVYVTVPDAERKRRALGRGDNPDAVAARMAAEDAEFSRFERDHGADVVIRNLDRDKAADALEEAARRFLDSEENRPRALYLSDLHLGMKKMAEKRGFASVKEHDEAVLQSINGAVRRSDTLYLLGDITDYQTDPAPYLARIRCRKVLVAGNHDRRWMRRAQFLKQFERAAETLTVRDAGTKVFLCHYPCAEWDGWYKGHWLFYGHIHNPKPEGAGVLMPLIRRAVNVSYDAIGKPMAAEELMDMRNAEFEAYWDGHPEYRELIRKYEGEI